MGWLAGGWLPDVADEEDDYYDRVVDEENNEYGPGGCERDAQRDNDD